MIVHKEFLGAMKILREDFQANSVRKGGAAHAECGCIVSTADQCIDPFECEPPSNGFGFDGIGEPTENHG